MKNSVSKIVNQQELSSIRLILSRLFPSNDVQSVDITTLGGMSNKNYLISFPDARYVLRIPGKGSEGMVDRKVEYSNTEDATILGISPAIRYFDVKTGIKLADYLEDSETLTVSTIKQQDNTLEVVRIFRQLHDSNISFENVFNVFNEIEKYNILLKNAQVEMYPGWERFQSKIFKLKSCLNKSRTLLKPCHNDAIPENFIKMSDGKLFLLDWEYSGMNDPIADIASLFLEGNYSQEECYLFLSHYYSDGPFPIDVEYRIKCYQILWDYLWALWTVIKESFGYSFGTYGRDRYERAIVNMTVLDSK